MGDRLRRLQHRPAQVKTLDIPNSGPITRQEIGMVVQLAMQQQGTESVDTANEISGRVLRMVLRDKLGIDLGRMEYLNYRAQAILDMHDEATASSVADVLSDKVDIVDRPKLEVVQPKLEVVPPEPPQPPGVA